MGKKKRKSPAKQRPATLTPQQQSYIQERQRELLAEIRRIEEGPPAVPPPPQRHELASDVFREDSDNPERSLIKITCKNCAFLLLTRADEAHVKMDSVSQYCAVPFGTREHVDNLVGNWEAAVHQAYEEMFPAKKAELQAARAELEARINDNSTAEPIDVEYVDPDSPDRVASTSGTAGSSEVSSPA